MDAYLKKTKLLVYAMIIAALLIVYCFISLLSPQPPLKMIEQYQDAIVAARQEKAPRYAPEYYESAVHTWEIAYAEWQRQNSKIGMQRNFSRTDSLICIAAESAEKAMRIAKMRQDSLSRTAANKLDFLPQYVTQVRADMERISIQGADRKKFVRGELMILQGQEAFKRQDYLAAVEKIHAGEILLGQVEKAAREKFDSYIANLPEWQQWTHETIEWSRQYAQVAIIVEKMKSRCLLYAAGKVIKEYAAEFGSEWIGHKRQRGDETTPEGQYFVTIKKGPASTSYYKALEINYPNEKDIIKFQEAKRAGLIAKDAAIGGLIEIHGEGGKGANWTQGCIALKNEDMDELFDLAQIGTPVTIVGIMHSQ
ncbi:L,D-transpeptidase family protein [candidate division KSB1 bacterium]|nr:L,D-transpeptidase family protein [candidate division KSB1 bacterium]RQW05171.1 MAG: hypothetical protein EH222_10250 [candidate division KSB1 bacterium]